MSFRGWSNCQVMFDMIADKEAFSWALRILKTWAKRRGIYGFNFGYLNGISLIIMLVKTSVQIVEDKKTYYPDLNKIMSCQNGPLQVNEQNLLVNRVTLMVVKFFDMYSKWNYKDPIIATDIQIWKDDDEMYKEVRNQVLPIITPEKPYKCTT